MTAFVKKSFTRSFSKKWNSMKAKNSSKVSVDDAQMVIIESDNDTKETNSDGYGYSTEPSPLEMLKDTMNTPSMYYEGPPEADIVSDASSDDDSSDDDGDAIEKYGYGDASPDTEANQLPRRLLSRSCIFKQRRIILPRTMSLDLCRENDKDDKKLPFHPKRTPRRSSLKEISSIRSSQQRASIGTYEQQRQSIEEDLANGVLATSQVIIMKLPMRRESIKRRRSIQFDEDVHIQQIQPTASVKGANKKDLWFQDDEYRTIKTKTRTLLSKVDSNGTINGFKFCMRGLEKYMQNPTKRAQEKYQAWDCVLMEQQMQRQLGIFDDESIGQFYKRTSINSAAEAHCRASADAVEVASFYNH